MVAFHKILQMSASSSATTTTTAGRFDDLVLRLPEGRRERIRNALNSNFADEADLRAIVHGSTKAETINNPPFLWTFLMLLPLLDFLLLLQVNVYIFNFIPS